MEKYTGHSKEYWDGVEEGMKHTQPSGETRAKLSNLEKHFEDFEGRFDKHLEIYAKNGKELSRVATNQEWLMKFFWYFMTPMASGLIYLIFKV